MNNTAPSLIHAYLHCHLSHGSLELVDGELSPFVGSVDRAARRGDGELAALGDEFVHPDGGGGGTQRWLLLQQAAQQRDSLQPTGGAPAMGIDR